MPDYSFNENDPSDTRLTLVSRTGMFIGNLDSSNGSCDIINVFDAENNFKNAIGIRFLDGDRSDKSNQYFVAYHIDSAFSGDSTPSNMYLLNHCFTDQMNGMVPTSKDADPSSYLAADGTWKPTNIIDYASQGTISRLGNGCNGYILPFSQSGQVAMKAYEWKEISVEFIFQSDHKFDNTPANYLTYRAIPFKGEVSGSATGSIYVMPFEASCFAGRFLKATALAMSTVDINTTEASVGISFDALVY